MPTLPWTNGCAGTPFPQPASPLRMEGNHASLIARRGRTPLAITADLSTHLLEVCPAALKALSLRIDDSPWPTSAHPPQVFFDLLSSPRPALLCRFAPQNSH